MPPCCMHSADGASSGHFLPLVTGMHRAVRSHRAQSPDALCTLPVTWYSLVRVVGWVVGLVEGVMGAWVEGVMAGVGELSRD